MKDYKKQQYLIRYGIEGHLCHCGNRATQIAHLINQSKMNLKKYGFEVINHNFNLAAVCSLECNSKVSIGNKPVRAYKLIELIKEKPKDILTVKQINKILED